jgi:hypothetical protein
VPSTPTTPPVQVPPLPLPDLPPLPGTGATNNDRGGSTPPIQLPTLSAKTSGTDREAQSKLLDYLLGK